jgi:hypothetical protein
VYSRRAIFERNGETLAYGLTDRTGGAIPSPLVGQSTPATAQASSVDPVSAANAAPATAGAMIPARGDLPPYDPNRAAPPDPVMERLRQTIR